MRRVLIASAVALGAAALATAQQNPTSKAENAQSVIVNGCLVRADASPAAAADRWPFMLTKASPAQTGPAGTLGSNGPAQAPSSARSYRLEGHEADLTAHVGHVVEIRGHIEEESANRTAVPSPSASPASATTASSDARTAMRLRVDSVKELFAKCDR